MLEDLPHTRCVKSNKVACVIKGEVGFCPMELKRTLRNVSPKNVVENFREVSDNVWVSFEGCDYREDIKRGMNE